MTNHLWLLSQHRHALKTYGELAAPSLAAMLEHKLHKMDVADTAITDVMNNENATPQALRRVLSKHGESASPTLVKKLKDKLEAVEGPLSAPALMSKISSIIKPVKKPGVVWR